MRIALLCPNLSSNSLVRTYPIAKVLARRHEIQVVGFRFADEVFEPYRDEFDYQATAARQFPAFLAQVRAIARQIRADAVYAFKPLPSSFWVGLWARRAHRIPLFLDIEDWETGWYYDVPLRDAVRHLVHVERPNGLIWTWVTGKIATHADEIFVASRSLQERFGGTRLVHGADTTVFDPSIWDRRVARTRIGVGEGRYVVFTGSPMPNKGLEDLLEAVSAVGDPRLRVLAVGSFRHDPGYRQRLLDRYGSRLVLMGPRPHAEMPLFLATADVVVLPQRVTRETMAQVPGKVFEAMAMARPIVATAVSDLPEILDGCGVVVPPESVDKLGEAIDRLLSRPEEARALGQDARRRCQEHYSWDAMERVLEGRLRKWEQARAEGVYS
jgi:glycosyltransferase involved in cell wall biosynthesis